MILSQKKPDLVVHHPMIQMLPMRNGTAIVLPDLLTTHFAGDEDTRLRQTHRGRKARTGGGQFLPLIRTVNPTRYWLGVRIPIWQDFPTNRYMRRSSGKFAPYGRNRSSLTIVLGSP